MTRVFFGNFNLDQEAADHGSWPSHPFLSLDHARLWQKATKRTQKTERRPWKPCHPLQLNRRGSSASFHSGVV